MIDTEVIYYDFDRFRLDIEKEQLLENGQPVTLTHKAFQTLHILIQNFGQIVEKEDIYKKLWADSFVEESNLTQYIYVLRKILGNNPKGASYIETVARRGYLFSGEVRKIKAEKSESVLDISPNIGFILRTPELQKELESKKREAEISSQSALLRKSFISRFLSVLVFGLIILIVTVGIFEYRQYSLSKDSASIRTMAVLPFRPIGEEVNNEKIDGFGMADSIITRLSRSNRIPVRSTSAIFQFTDNPTIDSVEAGRELGVDAVLEGTIQRDHDRVRVAVKLIHVADGKVLWVETYDEKYNNVFSLEDSISLNVTQSISKNLNKPLPEYKHPTSSVEAYEAYQLGVYFWNKRSREDLQKAAEQFQKAIDIDPKYAAAYAMLADTYGMTAYYGFAKNSEMLDKSQTVAEKALALDDTVAEAHMAMSQVQAAKLGDFKGSLKSIERAIELNPYSATIHIRYAWKLMSQGDVEGTEREMRLAQEYDPLSPISNNTLCTVLIYRRKFHESVRYCEKAVEISSKSPSVRLALSDAYFFDGRRDDAVEQAKTKIAEAEDDEKLDAIGSLGFYYAKMGRSKETAEILATLKKEVINYPKLLADLTIIEYARGNKDEGFDYFKQMCEKRIPAQMYSYSPVWDDVRVDPRINQFITENSKK